MVDVKKLVTKAAVRKLSIADLLVDPSYQREVKSGHKKIVADFDEDALGIILVGEREDGTLWIVDGLQRKTALQKLGRVTLLARVFSSEGPEHEARVFKLINLNRIKLSPHEEFRALLTAHDETAWSIKTVAEKAGFQVLGRDSRDSRFLRCVKALQYSYCTHGAEALAFALECSRDAWPGEAMSGWGDVIVGISMFYNEAGGAVDLATAKAKLATTTPQKLMYKARQQSLNNSPRGEVKELVKQLYRRRVRGINAKKPAE